MAAANVGDCSDKRRDLVALDQIRRDQGRRSRRSETPDGVLRCRVEMLPQRAFYASCRVFAGDPLAPALCSRAQIACPGCQRLRGIALAFSVAGVRAFGMDVGDAQGEFDLATQTLKVAGECVIHGPKAVPEHVDVGGTIVAKRSGRTACRRMSASRTRSCSHTLRGLGAIVWRER